jgi:disulfide bond formation protein DsbB
MTDRQEEWRLALAPCYVIVALLALVLGLLRTGDDVTFWKLMYISVLCSFIATNITSSLLRQVAQKSQNLVRVSNDGWGRANKLLRIQEDTIKAMSEHIEVLEDAERTRD